MISIPVHISKSGLPCVWEAGSNGYALIIASASGKPKLPVFVKHPDKVGGNRSERRHALIPVHKGDIIVSVSPDDSGFRIEVYHVGSVVLGKAELRGVKQCIWEKEKVYSDAVKAAVRKASSDKSKAPEYVIKKEAAPVPKD